LKKWNVLGLFKGLGGLRLYGTINKKEVQGKGLLEICWANNYCFRHKNFEFNYKNKILNITGLKDNNGLTANIILKNGNVKLDKILYRDEKSSLLAKGIIKKNKDIDISVVGEKFDLGIITRFITIGFYIEGATDLNLTAKGNLTDPRIKIEAQSYDGKFYALNFDSLDSDIYIRKNFIKIHITFSQKG
jgi:hypothetical protein